MARLVFVAALLHPLRALPSENRRALGTCWSCSDHGSRSWWRALTLDECDCAQGWSGPCCNLPDGHHDGHFSLKRIANDQVAEELAWATADSDLPQSLQGIFWMDQRGVNLPVASDPNYRQVGMQAADELIVTFGEASWDPERRCAGRVPVFGGHRGHWTFMDQGSSGVPKSDIFESAMNSRLNLEFCFRDHTMEVIDIRSYVKASSVLGSVRLSLSDCFDGYVEIPQWVMHLSMVKKPWGWDRVTTVLDVTQAGKLGELFKWFNFEPYAEAHYPVFRIVDGAGHRTEHWEPYLAWANDATSWSGFNCTNSLPPNSFGSPSSTFSCVTNTGAGTQLTGVLQQ